MAQVDVRGGWTKEIWSAAWSGCGYAVPGFDDSQVVLIDTPGINEVDGAERAQMARDAAPRADLILFVTDSDLNQTEYSALAELAATHKPIILVLNKIDNYTAAEQRSSSRLADSRLRESCRARTSSKRRPIRAARIHHRGRRWQHAQRVSPRPAARRSAEGPHS